MAKEDIPFFPNHFLKEVMAALIILAALISLAVFSPAPIELKADPFDTPAQIKPEWYFLGMYQVLKTIPHELLGMAVNGLLILLLCLVPFLDKNPSRKLRQRIFALGVFFFIIFLLVVFTLWGKFS